MTRADAAAFSDALRAAIPRLHFVSRDHWKSFVDWDFWRTAWDEKERRQKAGLPTERVRHRMREPNGEPPPYWDSLGTAEERDFLGWVLPEGWTPIWGEEDDFGVRRIANPPRLEFFFRRSYFHCRDRSPRQETVWFIDPPEARSDDETIELQDGSLSIGWNRYDEEAEGFAKTVFRILFKQTIDRFITVEHESRRALSLTAWRNRRYGAAGRCAETWALARRHNYFFGGKFEKPVSYPFAPQDIFSAEERSAFEVRREAEYQERFQEDLRLRNEALERFRGLPRGNIEFESRGGRLVAARLYKPRETPSATETGTSRVALELRVQRRQGRAEWS